MKSHTTEKFRKRFADLPSNIREQGRAAYRQFVIDPYHSSLQFKRVHRSKQLYSARINDNYRVVGIMDEGEIVWFWVGPHNEYDKLLSQF